LGDRNPKWKEWLQTIQEFTEDHIQDIMELVHSDEQSYQLELQAYYTAFPDFKYETPSFVSMEIGTNSNVATMPSMVQPVTKPISPLKGGKSLKIIPLLVQAFIISILITIVVSQSVEGSERSDKKHAELVNPSYIILDSRLKYLEFLSTSVLVTPH
jgi:hypothetical protein